MITLPLGATEDRVIGSIDIEAALTSGERRFAPGLLGAADGGFLYVDEVNLLDDYIVDVLLDVAASGVNFVEREGISHSHPARFVLIGSGNPEEGDLRPQLEDRFGLATNVSTITDHAARADIVRRRLAFSEDPVAFVGRWRAEQLVLAERVATARLTVDDVEVADDLLDLIVELCVAAGAVGHRGELVLTRAARASAALRGASAVAPEDIADNALMALRHRVTREAFDDTATIDRRLAEIVANIVPVGSAPVALLAATA